jgi:hypothetical protein
VFKHGTEKPEFFVMAVVVTETLVGILHTVWTLAML